MILISDMMTIKLLIVNKVSTNNDSKGEYYSGKKWRLIALKGDF